MSCHATSLLAAVLVAATTLAPSSNTELIQERAATREGGAPATGALMDCLVYKVEGAALVRRIEAATTDDAAGAEAVRALLEGAKDGVVRLARFHAPFDTGAEMTYSTSKAIPTTSVSGGPLNPTTVGGYREARTRLSFMCKEVEGGFSTGFFIDLESFVPSGEVRSAASVRDRSSLKGNVTAPSGVLRMYQVDTGGGALVVFVTASAL